MRILPVKSITFVGPISTPVTYGHHCTEAKCCDNNQSLSLRMRYPPTVLVRHQQAQLPVEGDLPRSELFSKRIQEHT
jgi:hypothetical protein